MLKSVLMGTALTSVLALAGCNNMMPNSGHSDQNASSMSNLKMLTDVSWQQIMPANTKMSTGSDHPNIRFNSQDKRFSGSDGCNRIMGDYEANGKMLKLGMMAGTKMACAPQDSAMSQNFMMGLSKTTHYQFSGSDLVLKDQVGKTLMMLRKAN